MAAKTAKKPRKSVMEEAAERVADDVMRGVRERIDDAKLSIKPGMTVYLPLDPGPEDWWVYRKIGTDEMYVARGTKASIRDFAFSGPFTEQKAKSEAERLNEQFKPEKKPSALCPWQWFSVGALFGAMAWPLAAMVAIYLFS